MKSHEYAPDNMEKAEQTANERNPWESVIEVPFAGNLDEDENLSRVKESMVPDETATEEEQRTMAEEQKAADKNAGTESPKGKEFEDYVDSILNQKK